MIKKKNRAFQMFEVVLVLLTVVTHWLIFYFILINSFKTKTEASQLSLAFPKEWNIAENYAYIFQYGKGAFFQAFKNSLILTFWSILILVLAWTLKGMTDALGIGDFVRQAVSLNAGLMRFVPLLIFCIAIFIAFSSGTSWGTFAILVPIVVNMFSETDPNMMIVAVAAVLAGAVCGDHISPISDTTIMSSSGAQSNHINHVQTQMQYAMVVVAACVPGYLIAGFTENWLLTLAASLVILTVMLLWLRKRSLAE